MGRDRPDHPPRAGCPLALQSVRQHAVKHVRRQEPGIARRLRRGVRQFDQDLRHGPLFLKTSQPGTGQFL
jgi:hypothetical protein